MQSESTFLTALQSKIIIADGAMGTTLQEQGLTLADFGGLDGCNEYLVKTRPDLIREVHRSFFAAGADVVETNTFGGSALVLAEYGIAEEAYPLAKTAAALAREAADSFATSAQPRFVAGSLGPTTKLLTLGHVTFDEMHAGYFPCMKGLLDGGIDLFQIETCQDPLQIKCAVIAARDAMAEVRRYVPICVTVTVETTGTLLVGTDIAAALTVLESLPVDVVGLNCATGPDRMQEYVRYLGSHSARPIAVLPNAGLPRNEGGRAVYDLTPAQLRSYHERFVEDFGVAMVGGCCGTTPEHIQALAEALGGRAPMPRSPKFEDHVSSLYSAVPLDQEGSSPLIVGERCNANGSKKFRELLLAGDIDGIVDMGQTEVREGAHVLDICTAFVGRDEVQDMQNVLRRFVSEVNAPLMIDSTQEDVLEAGLKLLGSRAIINSINLEDGEEKLASVCRLARRFGAALIALTIDEEGMAKSADRKLAIANRIYSLCVDKHGIDARSLLFDPLTFTIGSGDEESRRAGIETLEGIRLIKEGLPEARTLLGLSNISFGLKPFPRQILNSVFLHEAIEYGLDACIVHSKKILPMHLIDGQARKVALDLIYDRREGDYDPLFRFMELLQDARATHTEPDAEEGLQVEEVLKRRIIEGRKKGIESILDRALDQYSALAIINDVLLDGMKTVGELFASGEMQLPFVLKSAETMKASVSYLEQFMEKEDGDYKGTMVLATVKGDVHDIGKNLVDIILSNNGYRVVNLGIKQPIENILDAAAEHRPDAIGMSGLLVKSTAIMKENLQVMAEREIATPVICGGAALNRAFVEHDLRESYSTGEVFYGLDAFAGLRIMDELTGVQEEKIVTKDASPAAKRRGEMRAEREERLAQESQQWADSGILVLEEVPNPPFWGRRCVPVSELPLTELFAYINTKSLYANQWMYRRGKRTTRDYKAFIENEVDPLFAEWCRRVQETDWIQPRVVYGYFPCQSERNDLIIYDPEDHEREAARISFPRQIRDKRRCIADYFLPKSSGRRDVVAFHVVTAGGRASEKCQELFQGDEYSDYLHFYGLSIETAEALAEYWHKKIRRELGIDGEDGSTVKELFRQKYRGERYSFGYPACPRLEDQSYIFSLLRPEEIGVELTSEFQLVPEQSTSAVIVHHPEACYYSI